MSGHSPSQTRFRPDIQGLRVIAVVAVLLYYAYLPWFPGGYVGVDIFFVISGFLITSHLLGSIERYGRVPFADFYAKRVRRILPASFFVLVVSLLLAAVLYPPLLMGQVWRGGAATALYVPNVLFALDGVNDLSEATSPLFQHYWSLGIEEQFYVFWPLLLAVAFAVVKKPKRVAWLVAGLVVASFVYSVVLTADSQPLAFFLLPTRAWELGVGGLLAFGMRGRTTARRPGFVSNLAAVGAGRGRVPESVAPMGDLGIDGGQCAAGVVAVTVCGDAGAEGALVCGGSASEKSSYCAGGIGDVRGPGARGERVLAEGAVVCGGGGGRPHTHPHPHAHVVCGGGYASETVGGCWRSGCGVRGWVPLGRRRNPCEGVHLR